MNEQRRDIRVPLSRREGHTLKRAGIQVGVLLLIAFVGVDFVADILGSDDVIKGRLTFSLIVQLAILVAALKKMWDAMPLVTRWLYQGVRRVLGDRLQGHDEPALERVAAYGTRLVYLVVLYMLALPPVVQVIGGKWGKLAKLGAVGLGLYLAWEIWQEVDRMSWRRAPEADGAPEGPGGEDRAGPAPGASKTPAEAAAEQRPADEAGGERESAARPTAGGGSGATVQGASSPGPRGPTGSERERRHE